MDQHRYYTPLRWVTTPMNRHDPLKCCIEGGVLTIRIGVGVLAHVIKFNPDLVEYDEKTGEWHEPEITDPDKFAVEILHAIEDESEDGTTLVHLVLDTAAMNAIENGAEGIRLPSDACKSSSQKRDVINEV